MNLLSGALWIGRIFDINIRVHVLFFLMVVVLVSSGNQDLPWAREIGFYLLLFGIVLAHELGHCLGARLVGGDAEEILLWPLGGLAVAQAPMRPWPQFVTIAAGPLVNLLFLVLAGVPLLLIWLTPDWFGLPPEFIARSPKPAWLLLLIEFVVLNGILLVFNLLPVFPLDGGQLFRTIIWPWLGLRRSTIIVAVIGLCGAGLLVIAALMAQAAILFFIALFSGFVSLQHLLAAQRGLISDAALADHYPDRAADPRRGLWQRLFTSKRRYLVAARPVRLAPQPPSNVATDETPAPDPAQDAALLRRLVEKVNSQGAHTLSYIERQQLERLIRAQRALAHPPDAAPSTDST